MPEAIPVHLRRVLLQLLGKAKIPVYFGGWTPSSSLEVRRLLCYRCSQSHGTFYDGQHSAQGHFTCLYGDLPPHPILTRSVV